MNDMENIEAFKDYLVDVKRKFRELNKPMRPEQILLVFNNIIDKLDEYTVKPTEKPSVEQIFTDEKYLGDFIKWNALYPEIQAAVSNISNSENNLVYICGDLGSGKSMTAFATLALQLYYLSTCTYETVIRSLSHYRIALSIYVDDKTGYFKEKTLEIIEHLKKQDYNRMDWSRVLVRDKDLLPSDIPLIVYTEDFKEDVLKRFESRVLNSPYAKFIVVDNNFTDFTKIYLKKDENGVKI